MLEADRLTFSYSHQHLFQALSFQVKPGECLWVRGDNGAGKSTLLKLIVGLLRPQAGYLLWQGRPLEREWTHYLRQVVYVGHQAGVSGALTVQENLLLDWQWGRTPQTLTHLLSVFQLEAVASRVTAHLSQGQLRKVALLRLWMTNAIVWVLDEPLVSLDVRSQAIASEKIQQHLLSGGIVIMTGHQAAVGFTDYVRELVL